MSRPLSRLLTVLQIYDSQNSINLERELIYQIDFSWHTELLAYPL